LGVCLQQADPKSEDGRIQVAEFFWQPQGDERDASLSAKIEYSQGLRASLAGSHADHGGDPHMSSLQEFVGKITKVHGVRGYLLLRRDGQILAQNVRIADRLSAMIVVCSLSSESVMPATGLSRFRCLVLARGK
jgi:hypothetical protein